MAEWIHVYREQEIPGPTSSGVITEHRPGQKIAKAIQEVQERVVVDLSLRLKNIKDKGSKIEKNTLILDVEAEETFPEGGEQYQVLQRDAEGNAVWDWVRAAEVF